MPRRAPTQRLRLPAGAGKAGEAAAWSHLAAAGHLLLGRNYRTNLGEIDIITHHRGMTVFVEVKARRPAGASFGHPVESVTPAKQRRLISAAESWLAANAAPDQEWRIDVITVLLDARGRVLDLHHIENAIEG
jgi:putative endonuclease